MLLLHCRDGCVYSWWNVAWLRIKMSGSVNIRCDVRRHYTARHELSTSWVDWRHDHAPCRPETISTRFCIANFTATKHERIALDREALVLLTTYGSLLALVLSRFPNLYNNRMDRAVLQLWNNTTIDCHVWQEAQLSPTNRAMLVQLLRNFFSNSAAHPLSGNATNYDRCLGTSVHHRLHLLTHLENISKPTCFHYHSGLCSRSSGICPYCFWFTPNLSS